LAVRQPSLVRIIQSDYAAFVAVLVSGLIAAISLVVAVLANLPGATPGAAGGEPGSPALLVAALLAALAGLAVLAWRVWTIRGVYARGVEGGGVLTGVTAVKDRARLIFRFDHAGQTYECGCSVHLNQRTRRLKQGTDVVVVVDVVDPRRSLLRDLFA
jgi:hypothetical protein